MRVAVIGAGISGLAAAYFLSRQHEVFVFEKAERAGGHAWTLELETESGRIPYDVGFLVYNEQTYPLFTQMLRELRVPTQRSEMSFSFQCNACRLEYASDNLLSLLGGPRYIWRTRLHGMLVEVLRFYREGRRWLREPDTCSTLGEFFCRHQFSEALFRHFVAPMTAAIWSSPAGTIRNFPLALFLQFFHNHGLLQVRGQPPWRTIRGGSREYVSRLAQHLDGRLVLGAPVREVQRGPGGVRLLIEGVGEAQFDAVVLAVHSDQALALLRDADAEERSALEAIPYRRNTLVVHSDPGVMPQQRRLWASWNYHTPDCKNDSSPLRITYWINRLQSLPADPPIFVTLNPAARLRPEAVVQRLEFEHPVYTEGVTHGQQTLRGLNGKRRTYYAGAYLGYGFHEDGARSGWEVSQLIARWQAVA